MANVNKVFLLGRLTRDPELRYTPSGTAVAQFGLAVNRKTGKGDDAKDEPLFVDVVAWQKTAEVVSQYCAKGASLFIEGRLQMDQWEGKDGVKRSRIKVVAENIQFIGGKRAEDDEPAQRGKNEPAAPPAEEPEHPPQSDDIPF
jgi:single-strand DNA-binding protein